MNNADKKINFSSDYVHKNYDGQSQGTRSAIDDSQILFMEINGVKYTDVAVSNGRKYKQPYTSVNQYSTEESDAKLYYQTKKGILKIELEDGSSISINEGDK